MNQKAERIDQARRAAIRNRLISSGKDPAVAERWCDAWEAEAALQGLDGAATIGTPRVRSCCH